MFIKLLFFLSSPLRKVQIDLHKKDVRSTKPGHAGWKNVTRTPLARLKICSAHDAGFSPVISEQSDHHVTRYNINTKTTVAILG